MGDAGGGGFWFFAVLGPFGHGEVAVTGIEDIWAEGESELFFKTIGVLEVGSQEHEGEVGFGADHAEGQQLGLRVGADGLDGTVEAFLTFRFFFLGQSCPKAVVDVIKEVLNDPAFLGDDGGHKMELAEVGPLKKDFKVGRGLIT